jgi:hypothetical protein
LLQAGPPASADLFSLLGTWPHLALSQSHVGTIAEILPINCFNRLAGPIQT